MMKSILAAALVVSALTSHGWANPSVSKANYRPDGSSGAAQDSSGPSAPCPTGLLKVVQTVHDQVNPQTGADAFNVSKGVAWIYRYSGGGLVIKNGGENITSWQGRSFSDGRICFTDDNHIWKIVSSVGDVADGALNGVACEDDGIAKPGQCVPAQDPSLP